MNTQEKIIAIKEVQFAVEQAAAAVIEYLRTAKEPTAEKAHALIDETLAKYSCESPEGHIVAGGVKSAEPHEEGTGVLVKGTPVVIDIYPRSKETGYFADMTRTVCIGTPPPELQKMYETVLRAQADAIAIVRPGASCRAIQEAVEKIFIDAGYQTSGKGVEFSFLEGFVHSVGHGVGKEIHEPPLIGRKSEGFLKEGDVITIEPGLYYQHIGGVRLEDMILVTENGGENLTHFPKELQIDQVV